MSATRAWLPLLVIYFFTFAYFNIFHVASPQYNLRRSCLDLGFPADCKENAALKAAAELSIPILVIPGIIMIVTVGIFGALSNRLGRKLTLSIALAGQCLSLLGWFLVFTFPDRFHNHWKILVIGAQSIQALSGGILILYLSIFGIVSDISTKNPSLRSILYVSFDIMAGLAGVIGSQSAALLMRLDPRYLVYIVMLGYIINIVITLTLLPETLEDKIRLQPIDTKKANTLGQLAFIFPFKATKALLHADAEKVHHKISKLYKLQQLEAEVKENGTYISPNINNIGNSLQLYQDNLDLNDGYQNSPILSPSDLQTEASTLNALRIETSPYNEDETLTYMVAAEAVASGAHNMPLTFDELEYAANGIKNTIMHDSPLAFLVNEDPVDSPGMSPLVIGGQDGQESPLMLGRGVGKHSSSSRANGSSQGIDDEFSLNSSNKTLLDGNETKKNKKNKKSKKIENDTDENGIPKLKLSQPPRLIEHGNAFLMLILCLFFNVLVVLGYSVCLFYYLKKAYQVTPQDYSNLTSLTAVVRGLASFLLFPVFKKFIHTPTGEKYLLIALMALQTVVFCLLPFCKTFIQFSCVIVIYFVSNSFPSGLIRSLLSNQITQQLQQQVLSAIASAEVFVFVWGGLGFNLIWLGTQDEHPTYLLCSFALVCALASICPLFINDSNDDFNLRIEMTTQYTKIRTAEKTAQAKKTAKIEENDYDNSQDGNDYLTAAESEQFNEAI
jgi:MFS family permease